MTLYDEWITQRALDTIQIRKHIKETHLLYLPNDPIWKDIYDESKLNESSD